MLTRIVAGLGATALLALACKANTNAGGAEQRSDEPSTARKVSGFLGHPVLRMPSPCREEVVFTDSFRFKSKTCVLDDAGTDQKIYAVYFDEDVYPGANGTFLKAYAIIGNSITASQDHLRAYLKALEEKYGPLETDSRTTLCADSGESECVNVQAYYTPGKSYSSTGMVMAQSMLGYQGATFSEVSLANTDAVMKLAAARTEQAAETARTLVK